MKKFIVWFKELKWWGKTLCILGVLGVMEIFALTARYTPQGNAYCSTDSFVCYYFGTQYDKPSNHLYYSVMEINASGELVRSKSQEGTFTYDKGVIHCKFDNGEEYDLEFHTNNNYVTNLDGKKLYLDKPSKD